jgi:drug/metabolite transporter (DMT)-like permease
MLGVFMPISFIFVAITLITVDTSTLANSIQKVTFVLVTIDIKGSSLSGTTARSVFVFTILCDELILTISVLSHDLEIE